MKRTLTIAFACTAICFTHCKKDKSTPAPEVEAAWSSSAQWGTWTNGGYTLYNNIWGSGAGSHDCRE